MILEIVKYGLEEIKDFCYSRLEIELPKISNSQYKYINKVEYSAIKDIQYIINVDNQEVLNSNTNLHSKICGITLLMFDEIEEVNQINIIESENNFTVYLSPYQLYRGCLNTILCNDNIINNTNNIELIFTINVDITFEDIVKYNLNSDEYIQINEYDYINSQLPQILNWRLINEETEDELPNKRGKYNE